MFINFFFSELRYSLRQPMIYLFFGIVFLLVFAANVTDNVTIGGSIGNVYRNGPHIITTFTIILTLFGLLFAAAFFNNSALRDHKHNFQEILYSTPIDKFGYYIGKFSASLFLSTIPLLGVYFGLILGSKIAPLMGWIQADRFGPFYIETFINNYFLFILPNMFIGGAIIYSLAQEFKSTMISFVGAMLILMGYTLASELSSDIDNETIAALIDVFGVDTYNITSKYYTPLEKNTLSPSFSGLLLYNRLIWISFASLILLAFYKRFSFSERRSKKIKLDTQEQLIKTTIHELPTVNIKDETLFLHFKSFFKMNLTSIYKHVTFRILFVFIIINLIAGFTVGYEYYGLKYYPVTYQMSDDISGASGLFVIIMLVFFSGELVWRDRDCQINEVVDSTPHLTLIPLFSKTLSLFSLSIIIHLFLILVAIFYQLIMGYTQIDFFLYLKDYLYNYIPLWFATSASLVAIQVIVNHKYIGYMISILLLLVLPIILTIMDIGSNMLDFGATPYMIYSDLNGFGPSNKGVFWFSVYWVLFSIFLLTLSGMIWNRGSYKTFKERIRSINSNTSKNYSLIVISTGILWFLVAAFVFYNTQILNSYKTSDEYEKLAVSYEEKYKKFKNLPFPKLIEAKYNIDIFPKEKKADVSADLIVYNQYEISIDSILLNVNKQWDLSFDFPNASIISKDDNHGVHFYKIDPPMSPGDTLTVKLKNKYETKGFSNGGETTSIVKNGSFLNNFEILPNIGYDTSKEISDKNKRRKLKLPPKERMPQLEVNCGPNCDKNYLTIGFSDYINVESIISTSNDQIAIAPGSLIDEWKENNRNYYHYKLDHPSQNFYSFISGNYKIAKRKWKEVDIEIYYDSKHEVNIEMMLDAVERSLDYYTENFGPYFHNQARIIEFPRFSNFAQAFPGTMPYSESFGFIIDLEDEEDNNVIDAVIAHEMAHQWWAHQLVGANMQGGTFLSEAFSEYSSLMTMKKIENNPMKMREFIKYDHDRYLRGRSFELEKELPIYKVENQQYIHYGKGSVVLYALQDYIGESNLNDALKEFLEIYRYKTPYPTSLDFLKILETKVPDSLSYLIDDWFKEITLYDNRINNAIGKKLDDGRYEVSIEIEASKIKADSIGNETKVSLNEWIDIGLFSDKDEKYLINQKRVKINDSIMRFTLISDSLPIKAGIDPRHILIDRVFDDNIKTITFE